MRKLKLHNKGYSRIFCYLLLTLILIPIVLQTSGHSVPGSALSFTLIQAVATCMAAFIGLMALLRHFSSKDFMHLVLGSSFLGVALLEAFQTAAGTYWFLLQLPATNDLLLPWCWLVTQGFLAVMLFGSSVYLKMHPGETRSFVKHEKRIFLVTTLTILIALYCFLLFELPAASLQWLAYLPAIFYVLTLAAMLHKGRWRQSTLSHSLIIFLILMICSEGWLTPQSGNIHDRLFLTAHLLKISAYMVLLIAMLRSMYCSFRELGETHRASLMLGVQLKRKNEELAQSNEELEQFAFIASHDLQAPLRKIIAFSNHLKQSPFAMPERERDFLRRIVGAADQMASLIRHLLDYSRANKAPLNPVLIDLNLLLQSISKDLLEEPNNQQARIERERLTVLEGDPTQLEQIFRNLLSNALKYRHPETDPLIHVSSSPATLYTKDDAIEIRIEDNGIGIIPEHRELVFQMFRRLHNKGEYSGSGIGLAIVKRMVERHGGRISVTSNRNSGSTFVISLPLLQKNIEPRVQLDSQQSWKEVCTTVLEVPTRQPGYSETWKTVPDQ